ncbi:MAG TPA: hypothetical protein VKF38_03640 [Anaerolineaceae bacterium]|nr:hypothetical protein [Anaerolineaceae bacterium]
MDNKDNWKTKVFLIGAALGALTGLLAAYIITQRADRTQERPQLSAGDGVKLGLGLLGVLRQIADWNPAK